MLDWRATAVAALVAILAGVVFGLVPALTGSSVDVNSALKEGGRSETGRSGTLRNALVVAEIALALMLAAGAALMGMTFRRISPAHLRALDVPVVGGRLFTDADRANGSLVVISSQTAARRLLPGREVVGQRLVIRDRVVEVVGVVRDVRANPLTSASPTSVVYVPLPQWPPRTVSVVLCARAGDAAALTSGLRRTVARLDSRLAAGDVVTMKRAIVTSPQSATAQMLLTSALIALLMAAIGRYGVMAYNMARRTREIEVRLALGATTAGVVRHVMGSAARQAANGVVLGLVANDVRG